MLGSYMEDLKITPEQFEKACGKADSNVCNKFQKSLFEQVWAADDYEIFKRMMTQKNIELQLQALDILAQRYGLVPDSLVPDSDYVPSKEEEAIMEEVIKKSLEEHEYTKEKETQEEKHLEEAIQATLAEKSRLEAERKKEKELLDKALKLSLQESSETQEEPETEPSAAPSEQISPEEIARRREYLRQQRDRLLALKKQERQKQLENLHDTDTKRPKSSRAARTILSKEKDDSSLNVDPSNLAFRKSLAARLKAEVIDS